MIDYTDKKFAHPKPLPKLMAKLMKAVKRDTLDKKESAKAKQRANGQCEVRFVVGVGNYRKNGGICDRKDTQTHHLKGGIGRRNRGNSIMAIQKLRVCDKCHEEITGKILQPTTAVGKHTALTVRYRRVRKP